MPYIRPPRRSRNLFASLMAAAFCFAAVPSLAAGAVCPSQASSEVFAKFGDTAKYSLLSGGSFESGTAGWSLTSASVASGNESYSVAGGSHSLAIAANGEAASAPICVSSDYPSFRLFARRTSGSWGVLNVIVRWTDSSGTHDTTSGSLQSGASWTLSPVMQLGSMLPVSNGSSVSARLVFKPEPNGGPWAIDDVYVDPYRR